MTSDVLKMHNAESTTDAELEELSKEYYRMFPNVKTIIYKGTTLVNTYLSIADALENFEVRDDDVWVVGHSKSGTTWSREMVWTILNDLNFKSDRTLHEKCPLIEYSGLFECEVNKLEDKDPSKVENANRITENSLDYLKNLSGRRLIGSHLPIHLLPRQLRSNETKAKVIYMARNPKDVCISYYHFTKLTGVYTGDFEGFLIQSPFWKHVNSGWERRNDGNLLFLKYEDMKADLRREIKRTVEFLDKHYSEEQISKLEEHLSFANMKKNPATNRDEVIKMSKYRGEGSFMRKGEAGQWKTDMSREMIEQFNNWIRENLKDNESLLREFL